MKIQTLATIICFLLLLAGCTPQTESVNETTAEQQPFDAAAMEKIVFEAMAEAAVPGVSIAVLQNNSVTWSSVFGLKAAGSEGVVTKTTLFEAASLSKPVFAYAVLKLVDAGEFDLDKPLYSYVDEEFIIESFFTAPLRDERMRNITARMVLTHSTGLPNWRPRGKELILFNPPGEKFGYSGEGFVWLQRVVEKLHGKSLDEFMQEMVFEPLNMPNSAYLWREEFEGQSATRHTFTGAPTRVIKNERENAAASLITCADDFAAFMAAVLNSTDLSAESLEMIFTPFVPVSPDRQDGIAWGMGFGLHAGENDTVFWHWGDNGDSKAFMAASRINGNGVIYFANGNNGLGMVDRIVGAVLGGDHPVLKASLIENYPRVGSPGISLMRVASEDADSILEAYRTIVDEHDGDVTSVDESVLNRIGYTLMGREDVEGAIKIFITNTEAYPDSANVWDSLGEAYRKAGDMEASITNYRKALERDPDFPSAKQAVKELEEELKK